MNNEDYASYELALKLKECGFDEPCRDFYWTSDGTFKHTDALVHKNSLGCDTMVAAPLLYHAQKWLREKKGIFVEVTSEALYDWDFFVLELDEDVNAGLARGSEIYPSYEQALSAGIASALELIKKGE